MGLEDIVRVTISIEATSPQRVGFGNLLIVGPNAPWGGTTRVKSYQSYQAVIDDGFNSTDPEAVMALNAFSQNPAPKVVKIGYKAAAESWTDAITAIRNADSDWYGICATTHTAADQLAIAGLVETLMAIYFTSSSDANIVNIAPAADTTTIAAQLKSAGYTRTALLYHPDADSNYLEAAFAGKGLPFDPGSITWAFKDLAGITTVRLTQTQETNALGKNVNIFQEIAGVRITRNGTSSQGLFIDLVQVRDWVKDSIQKRVLALLSRSPKVPYTNQGIQAVAAEIRAVLKAGEVLGLIAPEPPFTVTVPDVLDTDPTDRAARFLRDVRFSARLAGAIHSIDIQGVLTV
jgi:hypothetical protein